MTNHNFKVKPGQKIGEMITKSGKKIIFRIIKKIDVKNLVKYINEIIKENTYISLNKKITIKEELKWIEGELGKIKKNQGIILVSCYKKKIIGIANITKLINKQNHVGGLGISIAKNFRNEGIGKYVMKLLDKLARKINIKILRLEVFSNNERAIHVYEKMGYVKYGKLPKGIKHRREYVDDVMMYKKLK